MEVQSEVARQIHKLAVMTDQQRYEEASLVFASDAFLARPGEHALDGIALMQTELGPPALADSLAVFECAAEGKMASGDHTILLGRVLRFSRPSDSAPLVYFRGKYSALQHNG